MKTTLSILEAQTADELAARIYPDGGMPSFPVAPTTVILDPIARWAAEQAAAAPPLSATAEISVVGLLRQHL